MSLLEAIFARGDESLSALIEKAWMLGCRLDAWTESFDFEKWEKAMEISKTDAFSFAVREYGRESYLPWENINTGIKKEYLWKEYQNASAGRFTQDCRKHCHNCGLNCKTENNKKQHETKWDLKTENHDIFKKMLNSEQGESVRVRLQYSKTGRARYLSHLELTTAIIRAMRRAEFPLKYSIGFHPLPKVSFGPALRVGIAGLREYLDAELLLPFETKNAFVNLNRTLPEGIYANRMEILSEREKSINSFIIRYVYEIKFSNNPDIERFMEKKEVLMSRNNEIVDIRKMVEDLIITDSNTVLLTLHDQGEIKVRLDEICAEVFNATAEELDIKRIHMFGWNDGWGEPISEEKKWTVKS